MRFWKPRAKRLAAMVCALALTASMLPTAVFADTSETVPAASSAVTAEEKTEETPVPDMTKEGQNAPSVPSEQPKEQPSPEPSESPAPSAEPTPSASPEVTPEPTESPAPSAEPTPTPSASPEGTPEPVKAPAKVAAQSKEQPSQDSGISPMAISNETIYHDVDLGIDISVQTGADIPLYVANKVTFKIVIDGEDVGSYTIDDLNAGGTPVTIIAAGYQVDVSIDDIKNTFESRGNNTYWLIPTWDNSTATIELTSFKTHDDVLIQDDETLYGTFSWLKGDATHDDHARTLTVKVDGEVAHSQKVYTPEILTNAEGSAYQYWFTPGSGFNAAYEISPKWSLSTAPTNNDLTVELTTKCPCGSIWCQCPGGTECKCQQNCTCDLCKPTEDANEIKTNYGVIGYKTPTGDGYELTVEIYVNGERQHKTDELSIKAGENDCLNFEPADGYYYFDDQNSYDIVSAVSGSWIRNTGFIEFVAADDDAHRRDNVLKIYLWTFSNHLKLNVDRSSVGEGDPLENVTGYIISFDYTDPVSGETKTYTYKATSFEGAQQQMIPYATNVTITPICKAPYEVARWSSWDAYSALTLMGSEGQQERFAYGNQAILRSEATGYKDLLVYIDKLREVTRPTEDQLIDNVGGIFTDDAAVVVDCTNTDANHEDKTYGLTQGTFEISELKGNSADGYTVDVTVTPDSYVASYNDTTEAEHDRADKGDKVITLKWEVVTNSDGSKTSAWRAEAPATIKVKCVTPDAPGFDTVKGLLGDVKLVCGVHEVTETYALTKERVVIDDVVGGGNGATVKVTVLGNGYLSDYNEQNSATIGEHTFAGSQTLTVELVYNNGYWKVAEKDADLAGNLVFALQCVAPDAPTDDDIADALAAMQVQVNCGSEMEHGAGTYALKPGTYGEPQLFAGDDTWHYTLQIMVEADAYLIDYNNNTALSLGYTHTLGKVKARTVEITFTYDPANKAWNNDAETVSPVVFPVSCHATTPGEENKPSGDDDNNNNNNNNNNNTNNNQNKSAASASASASATVTAPAAAAVIPQTGDAMPVGLLAGLAVVAAGGLAALLVLRKRRSDR